MKIQPQLLTRVFALAESAAHTVTERGGLLLGRQSDSYGISIPILESVHYEWTITPFLGAGGETGVRLRLYAGPSIARGSLISCSRQVYSIFANANILIHAAGPVAEFPNVKNIWLPSGELTLQITGEALNATAALVYLHVHYRMVRLSVKEGIECGALPGAKASSAP